MTSVSAITLLAVGLFAATNVDDLFVLIAFYADKRFRSVDTTVGQYVGLFVLFSFSVAASLLALVIPKSYVGLLGVFPILIGLKSLFDRPDAEEPEEEAVRQVGKPRKFLTVALVTIANGGDNVAIYTPAFASRSAVELSVIGIVFFIMTAAWCFAARALVRHPMLEAPIRRYSHHFTPFLLIGLGIIILYHGGSFRLLRSYMPH